MLQPIIQIKDLYFDYINSEGKETAALDGVSLDIHKGEFLVIIGHNGSGKSTLAKHMNALLTPKRGQVLVKGMDTKDEDRTWDIRQTAGMVFQNPDNQMVATIVEEDVAFGPENLGVASEQIRERVDQALRTVGMTEYANTAPHYLSGGQKQRVAIAGVIAMRPEIIILDEPTAMLDPSGRREVMETIDYLNKHEGITIVHITHYMEEAIAADRVVVMEEGKIVAKASPREIFNQVETLKSIGLDVPQVTELAHQLRKEGIKIEGDPLSIEEMVEAICR
ncbi:MAG: energy-coupling factor transporter ATPase [Clostridiales bacterium]|nr:energy-coupling factor transporter ATPase [Clostridia bacterium]MDI9511516.1 energy-coupling factor transporter ATPase [Bacillota bacterium]NLH58322.1 energy-coupling factor transporter ATPase [Clostridiales bacterium]